MSRVTRRVHPDAVVLLGAAQVINWQITRLLRDGYRGHLIAYVPIEGRIIRPEIIQGLAACHSVIAYTHSGAAQLRSVLPAQCRVGVIPHAIDRMPSPRKRPSQRRRELFGAQADSIPGTWVLNANRNDARKRPELTLTAFAAVADQHPDTGLILHCRPRRTGVDLRIERDRHDLRRRVIITGEASLTPWTNQRLHKLYDACEIGVNSSTGEGWGLIACEHASHDAAQIMPQHAGLQEIWGPAPEWAELGADAPADALCLGQVPDHDSLALGLDTLLSSRARRQEVADRCQRRVDDPMLTWRSVGAAWRAVIAPFIHSGSPRGPLAVRRPLRPRATARAA